MIATREEMKTEAIRRMKLMDVWRRAVKEFEKEDRVMVSERPAGAFFDLDDVALKVKEQLEEKGLLVYMVLRVYTTIGKMDSFLVASQHKEEWGADRDDLDFGTAFSWTQNYDVPDFSEFGPICWEMGLAGGPIRVG